MRALTNRIYVVALIVAMTILGAQTATAQANRASITGTVTDTSGANVPGVQVTATNTATGVAAKTESNQDGIYVIPNLFPGQYSVQFKRDGFETVIHPTITLESTQAARIDASLKVGAVTESVTVTTDAPVLDLEKPSEGTNMNGKIVTDLPLSIYNGGRFVENFAVAITPGYSPISSPYGAVVNGGQWFTKDYTVDGTSATANIRGDSMESGPSMEAVQEVQAQTSGLDAQSAITGGGVMSFNLKSGTNRLHGSGFLYGHNELLDANTWTNDYYGQEKPQERAWDYGFSLGGPIIKNKTFFFVALERYQQVDFRLGSGSATVPTPDFLQGNFSALLGSTLCGGSPCGAGGTPTMIFDEAGNNIPAQENMIYDPASVNNANGLCPSYGTTGNPCQFTGNIIPGSRISALSQKITAFYQNYGPQFGGIDANYRGLIQNTPSQTPLQLVAKIDHNLREQDHLSGSWIYNHRPRILDDGGGLWEQGTRNGGPLTNGREQLYWAQEWRLSEAHTFSPRVLNVLNFTYNFDYNASSPLNPGNWNSQLGFGNTGANTFPIISFTDNGAYGHNETFLGNSWQGNLTGANIITGDTVTWTKGRHNISFGGDFVAHQVNSRTGSGALNFDFSYLNTAGPGYPYDGFGFASFLLGNSDKASESVAYNLYGRQKGISLFAQDSYKVTPKLTLSMGLRWNYNFRLHEKYGRWANFDETAISPIYGVPGTLVFAKTGSDSFEKNEYWRNFGPTIGFAYQMLPKTVLRGAFGLVFNPVGVSFFNGVPNGFAPQLGVNNANNFNWDQVPNGYPGVLTAANAQTDPTSIFPEVAVDPRALRLGYSEAFNFGVEHELTPNTRFELSYIGNRGHRLTDTALAWNQAPTSTFLRLWNLDAQEGYVGAYADYVCDAPTAASFGVPYPYPGFCGPALAAAAPFPQMAQSEVNYWGYANLNYVGLPLGQSFYDSMVANIVKRTGRGLTMDLSYTWSRSEGDSFSAQQEYNGYYTPVQDFSNMKQAAHALTGYDLAHVVKGYASYELPFGRGRMWLGSPSRVVNSIVGGWTIAGIVNYYSGQPFHVGAADPYWPLWGNLYPVFNVSGYNGPNSTKHFVPLASGYSGAIPATNVYMPADVASNPATGVLPGSPTSSRLRCPGAASENASLLKDFTMGGEGQYRLSFRTEFYNLFNRHYYNINGCSGNNSNGVGASNFGQIFGVQDNPRQGQFAIRFEF
ncbi:MAG TPA: carboxypeptidase regulatory-like domain-containing protein [Candidatus Sulfotelmatobacter sp.]|nr:carboxypeptidase regulatory-like domain-containing protein [Candidatus Sulfotelmatobacter sp.]